MKRTGQLIQIKSGEHFLCERTIPASWNELTNDELMTLVNLFIPQHGDEFTWQAFNAMRELEATRLLLNISDEQMGRWVDSKEESEEEFFYDELSVVCTSALQGLLDFKAEGEAGFTKLRFNLTRCPFPVLKSSNPKSKTSLWAPADGLANISFLEMITAFQFFENYAKTNDEKWADMLFATLWRPEKDSKIPTHHFINNDRRFPLRGWEHLIFKRAELFSTIDFRAKRVLMFWWLGCRQFILNRFSNIFEGGDSGENSELLRFGWTAILNEYAKQLGGFDAVADTNAMTILNAIDYESVKAEIQSAMLKKTQ